MAISSKLLNDGENVVISTRQHAKALILPTIALVLLLAVGIAAQVAFDAAWLQWAVWGLVLLGIAWFTLRPFLTWLTTVHAFTDRRLITRWGIITRRGHDIPLARVSDISIEINLIDRPFGCGSLIITNASTHGEVRLNDIPRVEETQRRLNDLLHDFHTQQRPEGV